MRTACGISLGLPKAGFDASSESCCKVVGIVSGMAWSAEDLWKAYIQLTSTRSGVKIRRRCVAQPTKHQAILLQRLGLTLPTHLEIHEM